MRCIAGVYQQLVGSRSILYDCSDSVRSRYPNFPQGWTSGDLLTSHRSVAAAGRCVPLLHRSSRFGAATFTVTVSALLRPIPGGGGAACDQSAGNGRAGGAGRPAERAQGAVARSGAGRAEWPGARRTGGRAGGQNRAGGRAMRGRAEQCGWAGGAVPGGPWRASARGGPAVARGGVGYRTRLRPGARRAQRVDWAEPAQC